MKKLSKTAKNIIVALSLVAACGMIILTVDYVRHTPVSSLHLDIPKGNDLSNIHFNVN